MVVLWFNLLLYLSVSKHNMWSYYGWVCRRPSVNTTCGRNKVGFVVAVVHQETQYMVILWLGLSLSSVNKNNMWS